METVVEIAVDESGVVKSKLDLHKFEEVTHTYGYAEDTLARILAKFLKHLEEDINYDPATVLELIPHYLDE